MLRIWDLEVLFECMKTDILASWQVFAENKHCCLPVDQILFLVLNVQAYLSV